MKSFGMQEKVFAVQCTVMIKTQNINQMMSGFIKITVIKMFK